MNKEVAINPLTGRTIDKAGTTFKNLQKKQTAVDFLAGAIKRKMTKPLQVIKDDFTARPKRKYVTKKIKDTASKTLQAVVRRKIAPKVDVVKDVKEVKVKKTTFDKDKADGSNDGIVSLHTYIIYVNGILEDENVSIEKRKKLRNFALKQLKGKQSYIDIETFSYTRKEQYYNKEYNNTSQTFLVADMGLRKEKFIIPEGDDFTFALTGGYGGTGYILFDDGYYIRDDDDDDNSYSNDGTHELFGNSDLKITVKGANVVGSFPKYEKYKIVTDKDKNDYNKWVSEYYSDYNKKSNDKKSLSRIRNDDKSSS